MFHDHSAGIVVFMETLQTLMADRSDHGSSVTRYVTRVKNVLGRRLTQEGAGRMVFRQR
jgi:hypothetical protein